VDAGRFAAKFNMSKKSHMDTRHVTEILHGGALAFALTSNIAA
jgi:hypothetical protein